MTIVVVAWLLNVVVLVLVFVVGLDVSCLVVHIHNSVWVEAHARRTQVRRMGGSRKSKVCASYHVVCIILFI